jgi:hypothetical protein
MLDSIVDCIKGLLLRGMMYSQGERHMISQELLDILACPKCKEAVLLNDTKDGLVCEKCRLLYEIRDEIPVMLVDEAKSLDRDI